MYSYFVRIKVSFQVDSSVGGMPITLPPTDSQVTDDQIMHKSSLIKSSFPGIESYKLNEWTQFIYPSALTEVNSDEMEIMLYSNTTRPEVSFETLPAPIITEESNVYGYLDRFREASSMLIDTSGWTLEFVPTENHTAEDPFNTLCRPAFVVIRHRSRNPRDSGQTPTHWSCIEGVAESIWRGGPDPESKLAAYTAFHLRARPDHVSVVGILISDSYFTLLLTNPCRVYQTKRIKWGDGHDTRRLLFAWIWRLYHPEVDSSVTINRVPEPTFNITVSDSRSINDLSILRTGESLGRRTTIMASKSDPSTVIKEQYIELGRRYAEGPILRRIHSNGSFPGVIRLEHYSKVASDINPITVQYDGGTNSAETITRHKVRLVLKDTGEEITNVNTPRKVLMALYDVLEEAQIYQSPVFFRSEPLVLDDCAQIEGMCFSGHLLSPSGQDTRSRFATRALLIDFDMAEDQGSQTDPTGKLKHRTGTPAYMARAVRNDILRAGDFRLPSMPKVNPRLKATYKEAYKGFTPHRLEKFPKNEQEIVYLEKNAKYKRPFRHQLRFDAESVFWVLLWWCIQAKPKGPLNEEPIDPTAWNSLVNPKDSRDQNFIRFIEDDILHSRYSALFPLLDDMRKHLNIDLEFAKKADRKKSDYLHEAFQRTILNFLFVNDTEPFMDAEKSENPRVVGQTGKKRGTSAMGTTTSATKTQASRSTGGNRSGDSRESRKKPRLE
ncbi:hypothetical protein M408DRAFT_24840 [Serendipita vermifera MAFF 305830]|uniref:Fungal-type protein kinase domain-containing protein n=1 Tax=Serendipita vermifera MAFF 305830 TaxID=933852 RepID=A0A0C3B4K1_SERVB|nr:hypothetical protein M408DRAFT_24840 [Serendipita vermifera MAFF 305830]